MLGNTFYHETMRKCVIGFGTLFNDIHITRKDGSGNVTQSMKVPLAYGAKQKFLARLTEDGDWIVSEAYSVDTLDTSSDSDFFETQGDSILDFTERNPFGEVT